MPGSEHHKYLPSANYNDDCDKVVCIVCIVCIVCTNQNFILQAENMLQFLQFTCPKPYIVYTDSQACLQIANTSTKLGKVRHVEIRYHLVRCLVISGDIRLVYCITEDMVADIFTKIVSGAQDKRLSIRFYNDCDVLLFGYDNA